jgi:hypothetical protein
MVDTALLGRVEPAHERGCERMIDTLEERLDERSGRGALRMERVAELGGVA